MNDLEERIRDLEVAKEVLEHKLRENSVSDNKFKETVLKDLGYFRSRHQEVDAWIKMQQEKEGDKKIIIQEIKAKLFSSGVWGVIVLLCGVAWYAFTNWIKNGGTH